MPGFTYGGPNGATYGDEHGSSYSTPLPRPVENLTAQAGADSDSEIDLSWDAAGSATEYAIYQAEASGTGASDYTEVATTTNTSATVTGLENGERYFYRVAGRNDVGEGSLSAEVDTTTELPVAEISATDTTTRGEITLTLNPQDNSTNGGIDIYRSTDGTLGATVATNLAPDAPSYTDDTVLDGEEYQYTARRLTDHTETDGTQVTATTILPDEDQPVLGNGVEDEVAVNRENVASNNGDVRIQIRETGEESWDPEATGFAEFIGAFDTLTMEFVGREDGEEYEVRARTETEHVTGSWTDPVAIVAKFPGVVDLTVTAAGQTSVELAWQDRADNEAGQEVIRERRGPDGDWWPERLVEDVGPNTEAFTDNTAQPDREYRYRIRAYTPHTSAESDIVTATTDALDGVRSVRVPTSGPYVQIDSPDRAAPLTPTITDYDWSPDVNQRPSIEIMVPESDRWDELIDQPMRVWLDGTQLPIDTLEGTRTTTGDGGSQTVLEGSGGKELDPYTDDIQFDEKENHIAAEDLIEQNTDYVANVDNPATDTRSDVNLLSESGASIEDVLLSPPGPTDPIDIRQEDGVRRLQTGWFIEPEDEDGSAPTFFADVEGNDGAWSGNRAVQLASSGDDYQFTIDVNHEIPQGDLEFRQLHAVVDGSPAIDISFDGDVVESFPTDFFPTGTDQFDLNWTLPVTLNPDGPVTPGFYTLTVEATAAGSGDVYADVAHVGDSRDSFFFDDDPVDGVIDGPEEYPGTVEVVLDDISSVEQVIAGEFSVQMSNADGGQAVAISNDEGETWIEATNSETVSGTFAQATQQIRARVRLSGYSVNPSASPAQGDTGQSVDELFLKADLEDTPVLLDKQYRDRLANVLADIADDGRMVWELRRDPDADPLDPTGMIVEWTQIGQRTRDSSAPATSLEKRTTIEDAYERVVVFGRSKGVEGATFSQSSGATLTSLGNQWIVPDSERIYDPGAPEGPYERGDDYRMDWTFGGIEILDGGSMSKDTTYAADYEYRYRGEATTPTVDATEARTVERQIPGATSDRECDQLALSILKDVQDAQVEAELTLVEPAPDVPLVEAISHPRLPEGAQEIRGVERSSTSERTYRLANRRTAGEIVDDLREDYESLADVV